MKLLPLFYFAAFSPAFASYPAFTSSSERVAVYDFVEVTARIAPTGGNCFVDAELTGRLTTPAGVTLPVNGFCDSSNGSLFRIRFMATQPGAYRYSLTLKVDNVFHFQGSFKAFATGKRGLVRVDPAYPFHFIWEGTKEHYYWNGLTAYALMGWQDETVIRSIIDRAARFKITRLRVCLNGPRVPDASRWYEPVKPSTAFRFLFGPWIGAHPDQVNDPGWDMRRFDVAFWRKYERMLSYARDHDVVISVIFFLDGEDPGADPFGKANAGGEDERRYYRYAAARLAAYSNVMWDVTNEWHLFRNAWWVEQTGAYLKAQDPWKHLASCHGRDQFPWMLSAWSDFAMYQLWDEAGGYEPMFQRRKAQADTGRAMPQINEEYGYEDHYPVKWGGGRKWPARSADNRRKLASEIAMAGCYQTAGERANEGNGNSAPSPGGWINGGFDSSMRMPEIYSHLVDFFTSIEYWKLIPLPQASSHLLVLSEPGKRYVVYFRDREAGAVELAPGEYRSRWYDPRTGRWSNGPEIKAVGRTKWDAPPPVGEGDWVLLLSAVHER